MDKEEFKRTGTDHPRGCGENAYFRSDEDAERGSPPRMRGKLQPACSTASASGITPADAGKTARESRYRTRLEDHPRRCGENNDESRAMVSQLGSPPQVRGKLVGCGLKNRVGRITPAGAGKTVLRGLQHRERKDHPRRCGENRLHQSCPRRSRGSPPQVRGKRAVVDAAHVSVGITPAGAGKTGAGLCGRRQPEDHPRRCGENLFFRCFAPRAVGSPPQVRGKLDMELFQDHYNRITPAGAGKTPPFGIFW